MKHPFNPYSAPTADLWFDSAEQADYQPLMLSSVGRIGRGRYLAYNVLLIVAWSVWAMLWSGLAIMNLMSHTILGLVIIVSGLLALIPLMVLVKRRLNDMGLSGWYGALMLVPALSLLMLLALATIAGSPGRNRFGPAPCRNHRALWLALPLLMLIILLLAYARARQWG